ncbi:Uncharacterised protein [Vibrio cholerae]|uniref:Uncharacterized protein n=1 Tax=Vibrio cholerae TaxID=666 RepID=A0A655UXN9_VIBCL|nr:Uncharacterised protein [Vibrio cholerae]CSB26126.1 Uncharacterised protein [Vibrio cholerae]CSB35555.1 Uncharacterised protein [Vibrio cholerae]CSB58199.1 Uncharacterised protein [Vibrio cholerae]CSC64111.1 Uncharacterised protein [Vibrio cholerae]
MVNVGDNRKVTNVLHRFGMTKLLNNKDIEKPRWRLFIQVGRFYPISLGFAS